MHLQSLCQESLDLSASYIHTDHVHSYHEFTAWIVLCIL